MMERSDLHSETNLCLLQGVQISASVMEPTGSSARNPNVLFNDTAHQLHGHPLHDFGAEHTYDTYDGQNHADLPDWYWLTFPSAVTLNCLEMTMGIAYADGGWWTSLAIEFRDDDEQAWTPVENLIIDPLYSFADSRGKRQPFETYNLVFSEITCHQLRLIGSSGGSAQFTSMGRIAAYRRDLTNWKPTGKINQPVPHVFQLVSPQVMWDLSENLIKLTGVAISFSYTYFFLDEERFQQYLRRVQHNYQGAPDLWFLLGDTLGWTNWNSLSQRLRQKGNTHEAHIDTFLNQMLACATAPVIVNGQTLGSIETQVIRLKDNFDDGWHHAFALEHNIEWSTYLETIERTPQMTLEQLEGAAGLMSTIANTIANLAHRNLTLEQELRSAKRSRKSKAAYQQEIVRQAIDFMKANLEALIGVEEVAHSVALSVPHLNRMFADQLGRSPGDYLIDLKLERAKDYLSYTDMSVMDVCVALGYSPSYFSRLFKSRVGCTPGRFSSEIKPR